VVQSSPFELEVEGGEVARVMVRVGLAESEFWRTKVIEINPLWVLINQTSGPLSVVEHVERPQTIALTQSYRALAVGGSEGDTVPFTLKVGDSAEVLSAPRSALDPNFALKFALGADVPIVEQSITVKVWEHERKRVPKGWGVDHLGEWSLGIPVPLVAGDPAHLVMENPGGAGIKIREPPKDAPSVSAHLGREIKQKGEEWSWTDNWSLVKDVEHGDTDALGWMYTDDTSRGMKEKESPDGVRRADTQWDGEDKGSMYFRRRCWTRTQRLYLTDEANEAAQLLFWPVDNSRSSAEHGVDWDPASMVRNPCQLLSECSKAY